MTRGGGGRGRPRRRDGRQAGGRVGENGEVRGAGRSERRRSLVVVHLIVDEAPLLEKRVHAHDGAHVAGQIAATRRRRQVLARVEAIRVDHEVAVAHVDLGRFALVLVVEELGQRALLDLVQRRVVEPRRVRGHDDVVRLFARLLLLGCSGGGRREAIAGVLLLLLLLVGCSARVAHGRGRGRVRRAESVETAFCFGIYLYIRSISMLCNS